jgi:uncharacterized protein YndB with AHSA1/START domain
MTHPLEGTLQNRDGAWIVTLVGDFGQPAETLWPWLVDPDRLRQWTASSRRTNSSTRGRRPGALAPVTDQHGQQADAGTNHA